MSIATVYAIMGLQMVAWNSVMPIVPLYVTSLGGSPVAVGLVGAAMALPTLVLGIPIGGLVDRFGPEKGQVAGTLTLVTALAILAAQPVIPVTAAAMGLAGLAQMILTVSCQATIAQRAEPSRRVHQFGHLSFWASAGMLVGPVTAGYLLDRFEFQAVFGAAVLAAAIGAFLALRSFWLRTEAAEQQTARTQSVGSAVSDLFHQPPVAMALLMAFLIMFGFSLRNSFLPLYLTSLGLPAVLMGTLLSTQSLASMAIRPFISWAARTIGFFRLFMLVFALAIGGTLLIPLAGTFPLLFAASVLVGTAVGFSQPLTLTLVTGSDTPRGLALGLRITFQRLGQLLSPLLLGIVVNWFGLGAAFFTAAGVLTLGGAVTARYGSLLKEMNLSRRPGKMGRVRVRFPGKIL